MQKLFDQISVQKALIFTALFLVALILFELNYFMSGVLGAVTLYVLTRNFYLRLTEAKKWNSNLVITLIIFLVIITFAVPLWIILEILIPKINEIVSDREAIVEKYNAVRVFLENNQYTKRFDLQLSNERIMQAVNKVISYIPSTLNWVGQ